MNASGEANRQPTSGHGVVVVGAGQAGMAMGYFLKRQEQNS